MEKESPNPFVPPQEKPAVSEPCHGQVGEALQTLHAALQQLSAKLDQLLSRVQPSPDPRLVTIPEAAQFLGVSARAIRGRLARKEWPIYRCGRSVRVDPHELKALMKRASKAAPATGRRTRPAAPHRAASPLLRED